jgi:carboxyl-terminal processing protease
MHCPPPWRASRLIPLAILMLVLAATACTSTARPTETPTVTLVPATATPAGPTATPTPDLAVLLKDGGIAIIRTAYDRLLDEYIEPVRSSDLLAEAWSGAAAEALAEGVTAPPRPAFPGDREGDFAAFRDAYVRLTAGIDATKIRYAALRTMAGSLHDCHTFFLSPVASETINDTREGKGSVGIGVELGGPPPLVTGVIAGGPADRAGIRIGDRITRIDGQDASSLGSAAAFEQINGTEGSTVRLELRRPGETAPLDLAIVRERVIPQNVESRLLGSGVGYVRVRNFVREGIHGPLRDALTSFEAQGVTKWIIDLRDNPGGQADNDAISLFIKDGVTTRTRNRDGKIDETRATGQTLPVIRPLVLLTNNGTGSVAEAFAAALQEYGVAYVIGGRTNGCVGYTDIGALGDGSSLAVTTHVNLGPVTDKPLNGVGVIPDEAVARSQADIVNGRDPQLDAAIAHLSR